MKELPILFSTEMVQAILAGRKTQTRRVLKCDHPVVTGFVPNGEHGYWKGTAKNEAVIQQYISTFPLTIKCPFGIVGDRLWVRETWSTHECFNGISPTELTTRSIHYWADGDCKTGKKRSSIHMPKWASRILLEITNIQVERLNNISEADAMAEGIRMRITAVEPYESFFNAPNSPNRYYSAKQAFGELWQSINGADSWAANPWVWVIEFRVIQGGAV